MCQSFGEWSVTSDLIVTMSVVVWSLSLGEPDQNSVHCSLAPTSTFVSKHPAVLSEVVRVRLQGVFWSLIAMTGSDEFLANVISKLCIFVSHIDSDDQQVWICYL